MRAGWGGAGARGGGGGWGEKRPIRKDTVARVLQSFKPYAGQVWMIGIAVLISAGLGGLASLLPQYIIDRGLMPQNLPVMAHYIIYMLIAAIAASSTGLWYGYLSVVVGQDIMRDLRNDLFEHLQAMALRFFTGTRTGEIQSRLVNDVGGIQSVVSDTAANLLNNVVQVLTSLAIMIHLSWQLTILSVGILPVFAFL
ncbi:MAG TPA: ABC transporter transmembrane domain-containing protein, partial [Capsulimonadaceae bacterium]|nr:ABC transporter transmembrane domain-containing protein [Capsulimonadaceae bacterium]